MKLWDLIDERKIVEELLSDPYTINDSPQLKIRCYIKHLKQQGLKKDEIRNEVDKMMEHLKGFKMYEWDVQLQRTVNKYTKSKNCTFREIKNEIVIYKDELDRIASVGDLNGVNSIESEKVLFIMLILAKISNGEWVNYTSKDIFKLAKYKYKSKGDKKEVQRDKLIYDLIHCTKENYMTFAVFNKSQSVRLSFVKNEGEEVMRLKLSNDNIESVILNYLKWRKLKGYKYCKECGVEIKMTGANSKYCFKCAKKREKEKSNDRVKKFRKKENVTVLDTSQS